MTFGQKVLAVVSKIPSGSVMTYKEVAKAAGSPLACRAVGNMLNKNPRPIEIPCHRVVKSSGQVGGYVHGTNRKMKLLREEGVIVTRGNIIM